LLSNLTSIEVAGTSVSLVDYVKLVGDTFDRHVNVDMHISSVCCPSCFHIRAFRHIRPLFDSETSKTIACAIFGSRLDYVNSILTALLLTIFIVFIAFKTPWLESLLSQLPTPPELNIRLISFQFSNESILNWLVLSTVHSTALPLNICHLYVLSLHAIASASLYLPHSLLSTSYQHYSHLSWFLTCWPFYLEFPFLIISDLPNLTLSSIQI